MSNSGVFGSLLLFTHGRVFTMASALELDDIAVRAKSALTASSIYVLREIQVERHDDSLLLLGRVDTFYHKQLAQEIVRTVADGLSVINAVSVD